ncbi:MAG: penicillin-binding protein activator [Rickettsiales bacterium]|nr:penicillin-binding protein activator [Rickettsiales bacterium]
MIIRKIYAFCALLSAILIAGCTEPSGWHAEQAQAPTLSPAQMQTNFHYPEYEIYGNEETSYEQIPGQKNVSVLLPSSGPDGAIGLGIRTAVEMAFLQNPNKNISVSFFDLSGNKLQKQNIIMNALLAQPDIVIGPIFAEDVRLVRDMKPESLPVLSFSSDISALSDGVMTMALIPAQSIEEILKETMRDHARGIVIMAPKTASGEKMAGAAVLGGNTYDIPISGVFYYSEGNSESIKQAAHKASMFAARSAANTKAREILSDILVKEKLRPAQKSNISAQLNKLSKSDTLGKVPYDAVLFLGNANDSKTIASFLRYFDVGSRDVGFYGTALWDTNEMLGDLTMAGAKFAALPPGSPDFEKLYEQVSGKIPSKLDSFGFDAANLSIGMFKSGKDYAAYLLDPSGYNGLNGLFRLRPDGTSERALQIMELTGGGVARIVRNSASNFITPIYNLQPGQISGALEISLVSEGINPSDYIKIPEELRGKYRSKTFGANMPDDSGAQPGDNNETVILPEDDSEVINSEEFQPVALEQVDRKLIDNVEVSE